MVKSKKSASQKPGEANGPDTEEIKAAEQAPDTAKETNPVGEATQRESKDPYAEGKHIKNPEPNNNAANRPDDKPADGPQSPVTPAPETPNSDAEDQDEVAKDREEL